VTLTEANALGRAAFVEAFGGIFEHSPWVAERAWESRPFGSVEALHAAMIRVVDQASRREQEALLCAHPDLGTRARVSPASQSEQKGAGLDALTPEEFEELQEWNRQYREKFGFPFLYAVRGSTKEDILMALGLRLESAPEEEWHQALWEVGRIAWFRLQNTFQES
jgi:2-oxo-4-hydroxy-4-carboxy-5-ureidoimidazoline decarboxylase